MFAFQEEIINENNSTTATPRTTEIFHNREPLVGGNTMRPSALNVCDGGHCCDRNKTRARAAPCLTVRGPLAVENASDGKLLPDTAPASCSDVSV